MRTLVLKPEVLKALPDLPAKQYRQVVSAVFDLLKEPTPHYSKPLQNTEYHRIAVGEYRVIYRFDEETVHVVIFGKRNDGEVYAMLRRKQ